MPERGDYAVLSPPVGNRNGAVILGGADKGFVKDPAILSLHLLNDEEFLQNHVIVKVLGTGKELMEAVKAQVPFDAPPAEPQAITDEPDDILAEHLKLYQAETKRRKDAAKPATT